jgi:maleylacetoacetate isomerase
MGIVLYDYWQSSSSYRVRIALAHLGLTWRTVHLDLSAGENTRPDHLARNPQGLVPCLQVDGQMLTQSLAIIEYLDETRAGGLLPSDPRGRARVRALSDVIAMELQPVCTLALARHAEAASGGAITAEGWIRGLYPAPLAAFEDMLGSPATGLFCHGNRPGMADICLMPALYNARRWGVDLEPFPRIRNIEERLSAVPSFRAAHPEAHKPKG